MSKKTRSASDKTQSELYKTRRQAANRQRRQDRHLKNHPNDVQAVQFKANAKRLDHRRKTPLSKGGWVPPQVRQRDEFGRDIHDLGPGSGLISDFSPSEQKKVAQISKKIRALRNRFMTEEFVNNFSTTLEDMSIKILKSA